MKAVKCYGRKKTVVLEKSFIRNFFDAEKSSEFAVESLTDGAHRKPEFSDFSDEGEENTACDVSRSPVLFGYSDEENSPPKNCTKMAEHQSYTDKKKKSYKVRKEYPRKKNNYRKKPKPIWSGLTKVCTHNQPRWSEFLGHNFTVEGQKKMKDKAFDSDYDRNYRKACQTQNSSVVIDHPTDITNIPCILKERQDIHTEHIPFIEDVPKTKKRNSSMSVVCKGTKKSVLNLQKNHISDSLNSSGDLFFRNSDIISRKSKKRNAYFHDTNQTNQNSEKNISHINSVKTLEQKINDCMKSGNTPLNFADSFNASQDLFPELRTFEENQSSKVFPSKILLHDQESELMDKHPSLFNSTGTSESKEQLESNLVSAVISLSTKNKTRNISQQSKNITCEKCVDGLNDPSANRMYNSVNKSNGKLESATISLNLSEICPKGILNKRKSKGKFFTSTPGVKMKKNDTFSILCNDSVYLLGVNKTPRRHRASDFSSSHHDSKKSPIVHSVSDSTEIKLSCPNEILFADDFADVNAKSLHINGSQCSSRSKKSLNKKSYSVPKRAKASKESLHPVQQSNYTDESTKIKLLQLCNQDCVIPFSGIYDWSNYKIKKIGEGTYGEVFMLTKKKSSCVIKVIPVSECSGDDYQGLQNVLSEVKISKCLSDLRNNKSNRTQNFIKLNRVALVSGAYPPVLIDAWDCFSAAKSSYNDRPDIFGDKQLFVILELEYGGKDMTCFVLRNATEAESVLKQIILSLAIAEEEFSFEHRDLHLGNILIQRCRRKKACYTLRGQNISIECSNLHVTIIDFTLSRLYDNGYIYYYNLAEDVSLFNQSGDYQYEIYRNMKEQLENHWDECSLYSNVLWIKFLCVKLQEYEYSRPSTVAHKKGLKAIEFFKNQLMHCSCALECITSCNISSIRFESNFERHQRSSKDSILVSRTSFQKSKLSICK